jgi:Leucine-rich repeat (LRR) protein
MGPVGLNAWGCGDGYCTCSNENKTAKCTFHKSELRYFPDLPPSVQQLTIRSNYLRHLTRDMLSNLTKTNLQQLCLTGNGIFMIDSDAFEDLKKLVNLEISCDGVLASDVVANALHSVSRSFERLVLQHNRWETIPLNMFDGLQGSKISYIDLSYNELQSFNGTQLLRLIPYVKKLILDNNPISEGNIDFHNMPEMYKLRLNNTYLHRVPIFCDSNGNSLLPRLHSLYLGHTSIRSVSREDFICLPYLWKLSLSYIAIKVIPNNTFTALPKLQTLILEHLYSLRELQYFAFNITSLIKLQFGYTRFKFDNKKRYNNDLFKFAPSIRVLDLTNNQISTGAILKTLLWHLVRLEKLILQGCELKYLASGTFDRMPNLHTLIMKGNNLNGWEPNMFNKLVNLKKLYISENNIAVVNRSSLSNSQLQLLLHTLTYQIIRFLVHASFSGSVIG